MYYQSNLVLIRIADPIEDQSLVDLPEKWDMVKGFRQLLKDAAQNANGCRAACKRSLLCRN